MVDAYRPGGMPPTKTYSIAKAAADGVLVICRCNLCHRKAIFVAADLMHILPPDRDVYLPPFPCSKCGNSEYVRVRTYLPDSTDYGMLMVRRLIEVRPVAYWRNALLE